MTKIPSINKNTKYWQKYQVLTKIPSIDKNTKYWQKYQVLSKIPIISYTIVAILVLKLFLLRFREIYENLDSFWFSFEFQKSDFVETCKTQKFGNEIVLHCLSGDTPWSSVSQPVGMGFQSTHFSKFYYKTV